MVELDMPQSKSLSDSSVDNLSSAPPGRILPTGRSKVGEKLCWTAPVR